MLKINWKLEEDDGVGFAGKVGDIVLAAGRRVRLEEKGDGEKTVSSFGLQGHSLVTDEYSNGTTLIVGCASSPRQVNFSVRLGSSPQLVKHCQGSHRLETWPRSSGVTSGARSE